MTDPIANETSAGPAPPPSPAETGTCTGGLVTTSRVLWVAASALFALIAWACSRGFDLTDEGMYMLEIAAPAPAVLSLFGDLIHALVGWSKPGLLAIRLVRIPLVIAGPLILAWGVWPTILDLAGEHASRGAASSVAAMAVLGGAISYALYPFALGYNSLGNFLLLAAAGLQLRAISPTPSHGQTAASLRFAAGIACGLLILAKAPAGLTLAAVMAAAAAWWSDARRIATRATAAWREALGAIVGAGLFVALAMREHDAATTIDGLGLNAEGHHGPQMLVKLAVVDVLRTAGALFVEYWPCLLALLALVVGQTHLEKRAATARWTRIALPAWTLAFCVIVAANDHALCGLSYRWTALRPHLIVLVTAWTPVVAATLRSGDLSAGLGKFAPIATFMLLVAAAGVPGTNNRPSVQVLQHATPIFVLSAIGCAMLPTGLGRLRTTLLLATAAITVSQVTHGVVFDPYWYGSRGRTLLDQTETVPGLVRVRGVRVDPPTERLLRGVADALPPAGSGGKSPPKLLSLFGLQGVVYAVGYDLPITRWWHAGDPAQVIWALRQIPAAERRSLPILVSTADDAVLREVIREVGLDFPDGYSMSKSIPHPLATGRVEVWLPR